MRALWVALGGAAVWLIVPGAGGAEPEPGKASEQTYRVRWLPGAKVVVDGRADEAVWRKAAVEKRFGFPWRQARAPKTEFRALCDGANLYFTFWVTDADIVVLDRLRDEEDEVFEDRVEVYLGWDDEMKDYFCFEVDSRGARSITGERITGGWIRSRVLRGWRRRAGRCGRATRWRGGFR